jgi:uncharacterized protein YegL
LSVLNLEEIPFASVEFADNPEPRCPCLLLLDTSKSMDGDPIRELERGLAGFKDALLADSLAAKRVEISVVTFGPVRVLSQFQTPDTFIPPKLYATEDTPMGGAIVGALELIRQRKSAYKAMGIPYYRPWIFLITDGEPTDDWKEAAVEIKRGEDNRAFSFFAVGVKNADMETLEKIAVRKPLRLDGLDFRQLFEWLSTSLRTVSRSRVGTTVLLPPPGWAEV